MIEPNTGEGPGVITPDGCAVDFYAQLPAFGEAEIVHGAIPAGASVLELGCGTGRILRPLAELGHPVTGVDESADMLAHATGLDTVCSPIETLSLGREFDVVLLASSLINSPDIDFRTTILAVARRHTAGMMIIQRETADWFDTLAPSTRIRDGIRYTVSAVHRDGPLLRATIRYRVNDTEWAHTFTTRRLADDELDEVLAAGGFSAVRWLTQDRTWGMAAGTEN